MLFAIVALNVITIPKFVVDTNIGLFYVSYKTAKSPPISLV